MTISKNDLLDAIQELPPSAWDELWILVDYLKYKTLRQSSRTAQRSNTEGTFPELDLRFDDVETSLKKTWQNRQGRLAA